MATILVSFLVAKLGVHDLEKKKKKVDPREKREKSSGIFRSRQPAPDDVHARREA